jgi:hypothetical protein
MHLINTWSSNAIKVTINFSYSNNWQYFGYTYDGSSPTTTNSSLNSVNFYVNGILSTSGKTMSDGTDGFNSSSETITYNSDQRFRLASRWVSGSGTNVSSVWLGPVQVYRRAISALEIQQNFNALKGRFGI